MADSKKQITKLQGRLDASRRTSKPGNLDEQRNTDDAAAQRILDELRGRSGN